MSSECLPTNLLLRDFQGKSCKNTELVDTHILSFQYTGFQILFLFDQTVPEVYCELRKAASSPVKKGDFVKNE